MKNFEEALIDFLEKNDSPAYLDVLSQIKAEEPLVTGLILGKEKQFQLVLITPSRIIFVEENESTSFYLEHIVSVKLKNTEVEDKKLIELEIQFSKGNLKFTASKDNPLTSHFVDILQEFSGETKKSFEIPPPEVPPKEVGFDLSGSGDSSA